MIAEDHSPSEGERQTLQREIEEAWRDLRSRQRGARKRLRLVSLKETLIVLGFAGTVSIAWVLLAAVFAIPLRPQWRWLSNIVAPTVLFGAMHRGRNGRVFEKVAGWLARLEAEKHACRRILGDHGSEIAGLESRANLQRARESPAPDPPSVASEKCGRPGHRPTAGQGVEVEVAALIPSDQRTALPPELAQRVRRLHDALKDVDDHSLEAWLHSFERDADPWSEVAWWEALERAYRGFLRVSAVPSTEKKVAYDLAAKMALGAAETGLTAELRNLPPDSYALMLRCLGHGGTVTSG